MIVTQSMSKTKLCRVKAKVSTLNKRVCLTLSARVNLFGGNKQPAGSRIGLAPAQNKQEKKCLRTQIQLPIHPALIKHSCHVKVRDANDPMYESHSFSSSSLFHFYFLQTNHFDPAGVKEIADSVTNRWQNLVTRCSYYQHHHEM